MTELQIGNMHGEKVNGFFDICVYSLSSVSHLSPSTETVGTQEYTKVFRQNCAQGWTVSIPLLVSKAEVGKWNTAQPARQSKHRGADSPKPFSKLVDFEHNKIH